MAYDKIKIAAIPKRSRTSGPTRFERTSEWKLMRADLEKGLKPNEALQVSLTKEAMQRCKITNRRTIFRFLKKWLRDRKLPYSVKAFRRDDREYVIVFYAPVIAQRA